MQRQHDSHAGPGRHAWLGRLPSPIAQANSIGELRQKMEIEEYHRHNNNLSNIGSLLFYFFCWLHP